MRYPVSVGLRYTITKEDSVIKVRSEGVFEFITAYEMWEQIVSASKKHSCPRILGFSCLDKPLPAMDAYEHLGILESVGVTPDHRIAWVAENPRLIDGLRRAETVIRNRSELTMRVFENGEEATRWLETFR